jgi:Fe-S cluster assembly iron-binding protein IscA
VHLELEYPLGITEGRKQMLKVTPTAQDKLKEFLVQQNKPESYIRVYVSGVG